jgi:hypothetical protein
VPPWPNGARVLLKRGILSAARVVIGTRKTVDQGRGDDGNWEAMSASQPPTTLPSLLLNLFTSNDSRYYLIIYSKQVGEIQAAGKGEEDFQLKGKNSPPHSLPRYRDPPQGAETSFHRFSCFSPVMKRRWRGPTSVIARDCASSAIEF